MTSARYATQREVCMSIMQFCIDASSARTVINEVGASAKRLEAIAASPTWAAFAPLTYSVEVEVDGVVREREQEQEALPTCRQRGASFIATL
jgi:hypothetical protein